MGLKCSSAVTTPAYRGSKSTIVQQSGDSNLGTRPLYGLLQCFFCSKRMETPFKVVGTVFHEKGSELSIQTSKPPSFGKAYEY